MQFPELPGITTAIATTLKVVASFGFSGTAPPGIVTDSNGWYGSIQVNIGGVWTSLTPRRELTLRQRRLHTRWRFQPGRTFPRSVWWLRFKPGTQ